MIAVRNNASVHVRIERRKICCLVWRLSQTIDANRTWCSERVVLSKNIAIPEMYLSNRSLGDLIYYVGASSTDADYGYALVR